MKTYINKNTKDIYEHEDNHIVKDKNLQKVTLELDKNGNRYQKYSKTVENEILLKDDEFIKQQELFKQKELISKQKSEGVDYKYNDKIYKISLTTQDQNGLNAVKSALELRLEYTNFNFENGTIFKITKDNFKELALFFVKERNKFYI
tara:strand:+ start:29 stop:472 length:444 start_codon:yes stop_codon:yes gene_type:complete